eukprot:8887655-Pyramimonas_sp.AAC.1
MRRIALRSQLRAGLLRIMRMCAPIAAARLRPYAWQHASIAVLGAHAPKCTDSHSECDSWRACVRARGI